MTINGSCTWEGLTAQGDLVQVAGLEVALEWKQDLQYRQVEREGSFPSWDVVIWGWGW